MSLLSLKIFAGPDGKPSAKRFFALVMAVLLVTSAIFSLITKVTLITEDEDEFHRIAVVGPMSGENAVAGRSLQQGVQLYIDHINDVDGVNGVKLALDVVDESDDDVNATIEELAKNDKMRAVVGHASIKALSKASISYRKSQVPLVTPMPLEWGIVESNDQMYATVYTPSREARFLANYARNVMGHKLTSVIFNSTVAGQAMAADYEKTYRRFGTAIRYKWSFDSTAEDKKAKMNAIVRELKEKKDAGVVFLAVEEDEAAYLLKYIRDAKIKNLLIAGNKMALDSFSMALGKMLEEGELVEKYMDGLLVSTPLLFDTANETAQNFKNSYQAKFGMQPDWLAAYAYDSAHMIVEGLKATVGEGDEEISGEDIRFGIQEFLMGKDSVENVIEGLSGSTYFDLNGRAQKPVLVGVYNGKNIISALTQLNPLKPGGGRNLIAELKKGKVLYVNDRFMYKTNVVYTGLQMNEISEVDGDKNTADLDFLIWFRYRGKFEPQDLSFNNAVDPIVLETPIEEKLVDDMIYRLYRVKGKFNLNFTKTFRQYGNHVAGVTFNHNTLSRNNLLYVVDVLGIGLDSGITVMDTIEQTQALNPNLGWLLDRAWISQDMAAKGTKGDPAYVGFGADDPNFSKVDLGVLLKPAAFNARDFVPQEYFIYIGIFGFLGTIFAMAMDRKEKGRFWELQSWTLRVISWPFFLLAAGNLSLDFAFNNLPVNYIDLFILVYSSLWWLMVARLLGIAMERFVWIPLEDHTERNIPNVIRVFASVSIYSFASFGIIAFVYDQQLTSLLASTGLLAMIIGLAVQSNISNIFSGIVINLESPFNVGDWVQIGDNDEGKVIDITWRTTRVRTRNGYVISMPNGQVSEANIHNFNSFDCVRVEADIYIESHYPADLCADVLEEALASVDGLLDEPEREVRFKGVNWEFGWVSTFELQFWIDDYGSREDLYENVLEAAYGKLKENGIVPTVGVPKSTERKALPKKEKPQPA